MNKRIKAFTLIEILVALLIIAIACTAVVKAMSEGIGVTSHLQRSLVSRWVASNVLAQLQNGLLPSLRTQPQQDGEVSMWHRRWHWAAQAVQSNAYYQQVLITAGGYQLHGFVWQPNLPRGTS